MIRSRAIFLAAAMAGFVSAAAPIAFAQPQVQRTVPSSVAQMQLSFADVVRKSSPAVVNIYSKRTVRNPYASDPFWGRFFRDRVQSSLGSGVIVRADGVIVTNNHVVAGADEITVVLADRREFEARVLLADERTDLAVLRVNTPVRGLPTLAFHDSDDAQVGDIVLAIGNPFGVGQTVTSGIVSALARTQVGVSDYQFFIQTDAAINPGNSGGALVTMKGDLIGINTAIFSRTGGSIGIGFASPANMVRTVVNSALGGAKEVARPWVGVTTQVVDAPLAQSLGLDRPRGILVTRVEPGSPAALAGLVPRDVITRIDDFDINDEQALKVRVATKGVGNTATLTYVRNGQVRTAAIRLVAEPAGAAGVTAEITGRNPLQGAQVSGISASVADELGVEPGSGVLITELSRRSVAAQYGFAPGDVITTVNGRRVTSPAALQAALSGARGGWRISAVGPNGSKSLTIR
ncbi:MAG: Do family serine endopeptidase [Alphaproteobacteria bacterium]